MPATTQQQTKPVKEAATKQAAATTAKATKPTKPPKKSFAYSKDGKPYRSYRLVSVSHPKWTPTSAQHTALNKSKQSQQSTTHLGPLRAGQKIFDSWCRHNAFVTIETTRFIIQETTRGKQSKLYAYTGFREKLDTPRIIKVTNKTTNSTHEVRYAYRSKVKAYRSASATTNVVTAEEVEKEVQAQVQQAIEAAAATTTPTTTTTTTTAAKTATKAKSKGKTTTKAKAATKAVPKKKKAKAEPVKKTTVSLA